MLPCLDLLVLSSPSPPRPRESDPSTNLTHQALKMVLTLMPSQTPHPPLPLPQLPEPDQSLGWVV